MTERDLREYFGNVVDSVGDGVIVLDAEQTVTYMNPAAEEIVGLSRRQVKGHPFAKHFGNDPVLIELVSKTASSGMTVSDYENVVLKTGSHLKPVSATTSPLLRDNGEQIGTVIVLRDLTNIRELERALRNADRLSALGTLAAGLAHEIKNPLGGIKGAAQLLERELEADSDLHEFTGVMLKEVDRVNRIVEELLQLGTPREPKQEQVNLHHVIGDLVMLQRKGVNERFVTLQQQFDPSIPPIIGDESLLTQLFLNLIRNGIEAVGESGTVKVSTKIHSDYVLTQQGERRRMRMVAVEIADDGAGMSEEQQEQLFTPFFTTKIKGTGLGLVICQKIVSEHRGLLRVESVPGKGTTFTVMLPLIQ